MSTQLRSAMEAGGQPASPEGPVRSAINEALAQSQELQTEIHQLIQRLASILSGPDCREKPQNETATAVQCALVEKLNLLVVQLREHRDSVQYLLNNVQL